MNDVGNIAVVAKRLVSELVEAKKTLACAESCTGGWIAKAVTDIAGSSSCFGYGVVSYSDDAKQSLLGVKSATLLEHGAVSKAVVLEMAQGVLSLSGADFAVAVTGIAGPGGGSEKKPVGTVWFGWSSRIGESVTEQARMERLEGDRAAIRAQTVVLALEGIRERLKKVG